MVTIKQAYEALGAYLKLHGDKELLSVATHNGSSPTCFTLHVADVYDGPVGANPFTGRDTIDLKEDGELKFDIMGSSELAEKAVCAVKRRIEASVGKPYFYRMFMAHEMISLLYDLGLIDIKGANGLCLDAAQQIASDSEEGLGIDTNSK